MSCDTVAVLDFGCCVYHLRGQTGQFTVWVNGKQIQDWSIAFANLFKSVPFPKKRPRRPETGFGFEEMGHEFPFGTFHPFHISSDVPLLPQIFRRNDPNTLHFLFNRIFRKLL